MDNIGLLIKETRNDKHLTQEDLAKKIGINASTLSRWETGDIKNMRRKHIAKLSEVLNIPIETLMGWDSYSLKNITKNIPSDVVTFEVPESSNIPSWIKTPRRPRLKVPNANNRPIDIEIMSILYELTSEQKQEVLDFAEFLRSKNQEG